MRQCVKCSFLFSFEDTTCPNCDWKIEVREGIQRFVDATKPGGFDQKFFSQLYTLEANNFWFRARNDIISKVVSRYAGNTKKYLEIGCGTGYVLERISTELSGAQLLASEYFVEGLAYAQKRVPRAKFIQLDGRNIPFQDEFDLIGMYDVLEHIDDDIQVLDQIHKALNKSGKLVLTVPQYRWLWSPADDYAHHQRRYTKRDLHHKLKRSGFKVETSSSFVVTLFPLLALSRFLNRNKRIENYNPQAEFSIPQVFNSLFYCCLSFETWLISVGFRFPFGGSRVVVATKL